MVSLEKEGLAPCAITFGNAPFFAVLPGPAAMINSFTAEKWLYYPTELGKALHEKGIETCIFCHSGREVINGEYVDAR